MAESAEIDDEDDEAGQKGSDAESEVDDEDDDEEESDVESDDEDEEMGTVDPACRARVAAALQVSGMDVDQDAEDDEDEESDEEVWDDEQMMKVDEQLAAVFKERAGAGKKVVKSESIHSIAFIYYRACPDELYRLTNRIDPFQSAYP